MKSHKSQHFKLVIDLLGVLAINDDDNDDNDWCVALIIEYDYNYNNPIPEKKFLVMRYNLNDIYKNTYKKVTYNTELFNGKCSNIFKPYAINPIKNSIYQRPFIRPYNFSATRFTCPRLTYETI